MKATLNFLLIAALAFATFNLNAQVTKSYYKYSEVISCESVSGGKPVGKSSSFYLSGGHVEVTFQVDNDGRKMKTEKLIVDIWKKDGGDYDKFVDTERFTIEYDWTKPYFKIDFESTGDFKVAVYNGDEVYINTSYVTIKGGSSSSNSGSVSTDYYNDSEIISCEEVEGGSPKGKSSTFTIGDNGGYVTFQVDNDGRKMKTETLIVDVWKKDGGDYDEFVETKRFTIEYDWTKPFFKYTFKDGGDYKIAVYNKDEVWINTAYVTINKKGSSNKGNSSNNSGNVGADYYKGSEIFACEEVVSGRPKGVSNTFTVTSSGGIVTFQVDNDGNAMKTEKLIVDIWKQPSGSDEYTEFVETKNFTIQSNWTAPYFTYTFYDSGKYMIAVYSEEEDWINTSYIKINRR